jgi:hypothetical protein
VSIKVNEFEIDKDRLRQMLGSMVAKGISDGDYWWLPTNDGKTIKLVVREKRWVR